MMENWKVVTSKSDKHPEFGYPMGQILCKSQKEAEEYVQKSEFKDLEIKEFKDEWWIRVNDG